MSINLELTARFAVYFAKPCEFVRNVAVFRSSYLNAANQDISRTFVQPIACEFIYLARSAKLPTGLYILLASISSFFLFFLYYEQSYLSIYLTNFHDLFIKWKVFAWIFFVRSSFSESLRDVAMATVAKLAV